MCRPIVGNGQSNVLVREPKSILQNKSAKSNLYSEISNKLISTFDIRFRPKSQNTRLNTLTHSKIISKLRRHMPAYTHPISLRTQTDLNRFPLNIFEQVCLPCICCKIAVLSFYGNLYMQ